MRRMRFAALLIAVSAQGAPAQVPELPRRAVFTASAVDWVDVGREATELLQQYVRINTTNPPGNEILAARWIQAVLARDGIESRIYEPAPGKANIVARLAGDGSARPIVLLNHMDVVEATPEFWSVPPFAGTIQDGYLYGRGTVDMKGIGITQLMGMVLLKRAGVPLKRDIIFIATCDEEIGGLSTLGAQWIASQHPEILRGAEYLINEGGGSDVDPSGAIRYYGVGTTEKAPFWLAVTTHGRSGHGSRPVPDNAVAALVRAMDRVASWQTPLTVTPTVGRFFRDLSTRESDPRRRAWLADVRAALADPEARGWFTSDIYYNAILRNTISVTVVRGSGQVNVIPPIARGEVDVRLLPGQDPQSFLADLRRIVNDTAVTIEPMGRVWDATESSGETELMRVITAAMQERNPGVLVTTPMLTAFTDSHYFRRMGITAYGFDPWVLPTSESGRIHGNDERISPATVEYGAHLTFDVLKGIAGR
jgi:acetylornithine deacetylase/succinyl-diaminopimelate desuccinylase-like protein